MWIGYLQWHFRIRGNAKPAEPVLRNFRNIEHRDALLTWRGEELVRGANGRPLTRWDGHTKKPHPVTGKMVPDENARVEIVRLIGAQPARWPQADFIIGNPPFIGGKDIRAVQGEGYAEALWDVYRQMPQCGRLRDVLVEPRRAAGIRRACPPLWPDHHQLLAAGVQPPGSQSASGACQRRLPGVRDPESSLGRCRDAAAVRIAMTVGIRGRDRPGRLLEVTRETPLDDGESEVELSERVGVIHADLRIGADLTRALPLHANEGLVLAAASNCRALASSSRREQAKALGLGRVPGLEQHIRAYLMAET